MSMPDKQGTPEEGWWIQQPERCISTNDNKDEDIFLVYLEEP